MPTFKNIDSTKAWKELGEASSLKELLSAERIEHLRIDAGAGLSYSYAAMPVSDETLKTLANLAKEQELVEKYHMLLNGAVINTGEKRLVLHQLTRGQVLNPVIWEGEDKGAFYAAQLKAIKEFVAEVHAGRILGSTGKKFRHVVQIGIGGSDLGPRALYLALKGLPAPGGSHPMQAHFISNVDPDDTAEVLKDIDPEETLFILVSKSGTTQETLTNCGLVAKWVSDHAPEVVFKEHFVCVTSATSPLATPGRARASFFIDDFIGGRYSSTSAVGGVILSLALGYEVFEELLAGAHEADVAASNPDITKNAALMDAMIGVYLRKLGYGSTAILPYAQALSRFPAHLQQLDMESNGKSVNRDGEAITEPAGPVIFGEPGTNGQHSFYQLLHQGKDIVPLQFIGFRQSQSDIDYIQAGNTSMEKLNANLVAQIVAFAHGKDDENANKRFAGERPSSLLVADKLTPRVLGALLAHYENKVMFQGFAWNLNSFDQEGVQLGKVLTNKVLSGSGDPILDAYLKLLS